MLNELADPLWRMQNLYSCREEGTGRALPLELRPEQEILVRHLLEQPTVPLYVIKSRRLGVSTLIDTFQADQAVWTEGWRGFILDLKQEDATKKMVEIVRFAVDSLDPRYLANIQFDKRNDSELRLRLKDKAESEDSVIYATVGGRGGDCSMLHVSEWGPISAKDPQRSREIRTGAFPAARRGRRVVETTWYGGKAGDLWDLVKPIMDGNPNGEGVIHFFPWHTDPQAIRFEGEITPEIEDYFKDLASKVSRKFSQEQKKWYASKKVEQGMFVKREYPSTLDEALSVPMAGTIYGDLIDQLREKKHIQDFPPEANFPAYTFWDIGMSDYGCVWFVQFVGRDILLLDYVSRTGQPAAFYVGWVRAKEREHGVTVRGNFMPHDAEARNKDMGKTYVQTCQEAGLEQIRVVHRTPDIWLGINELRTLLPRCYIHAKNCTAVYTDEFLTIPSGMDCLENYHKKEETSGDIIREEPVHDQYSHGASALRTMSEAHRLGMLEGTSSTAKENRNNPVKVLRGPSEQSYSINKRNAWGGRTLR